MNKFCHKGFSLVEAIVSIALVSVVLISLSSLANFISKASSENITKVQAMFLAEEGLEVTRLLRDNSWSANIASKNSGEVFHLAFDGDNWSSTANNIFVDGIFERSVVLENVFRDGSYEIVSSGGTLDPNTRKVTVSVSWFARGATTTRSLSTYLANIFDD